MTAGQITARYRQIRTSFLVTGLAVTFGIGLLAGLVASRTVGQGVQVRAGANAGVVTAATGSGTYADKLALLRAQRELQAAANGRAVQKPSAFVPTPALDTTKPYLTIQQGIVVPPGAFVAPAADPAAARPGGGSPDIRGGHNIQLPTRIGGP